MARKQRGVGGLSKEQLYNFVKVKGAQVITNFNHDPAKNASSAVMKYGTGATTTSLGHAQGKVFGGHVYYLDDGVWYPTYFSGEGFMGAGNLLGIALGKFARYSGTPTEVGMLISGVTTTSVFGAAAVGVSLYGAYNAYGRMAAAAPSGGSGRVIQKLGHALGQQLVTVEGASYYETIVLFNPDLTYTTT
jgi:hypothetical protein